MPGLIERQDDLIHIGGQLWKTAIPGWKKREKCVLVRLYNVSVFLWANWIENARERVQRVKEVILTRIENHYHVMFMNDIVTLSRSWKPRIKKKGVALNFCSMCLSRWICWSVSCSQGQWTALVTSCSLDTWLYWYMKSKKFNSGSFLRTLTRYDRLSFYGISTKSHAKLGVKLITTKTNNYENNIPRFLRLSLTTCCSPWELMKKI